MWAAALICMTALSAKAPYQNLSRFAEIALEVVPFERESVGKGGSTRGHNKAPLHRLKITE
jgi:hypothetical protein